MIAVGPGPGPGPGRLHVWPSWRAMNAFAPGCVVASSLAAAAAAAAAHVGLVLGTAVPPLSFLQGQQLRHGQSGVHVATL